MLNEDLPFLDITAADFSTRGAGVIAAREHSWCARTPYGLAILRHREAGQLLRDRRLRQGSHNWPDLQNLEGSFADFWCRSIISLEGPEHKRLRLAAQSALADDFVLSLRPKFRQAAASILPGILDRDIDFVDQFSEPFAGLAMTCLFDLPDEMAGQIAHDASRLGLAMGVGSKRHEPVFNAACDRLMSLAETLVEQVRNGRDGTSYAARLARNLSSASDHQNLLDLIVISLFGGVDTTRAQLGFSAALFARHPQQWDQLRADHKLIAPAIEEVIRHWPTTTWATREAVEPFEFGGVSIDKGETVHVFVHASATDPARFEGHDFDITARRRNHFGFGGGAHHCLGQFVARTDMAEALAALSEHVVRFELSGQPEWTADSGNTSPLRLPMRLHSR